MLLDESAYGLHPPTPRVGLALMRSSLLLLQRVMFSGAGGRGSGVVSTSPAVQRGSHSSRNQVAVRKFVHGPAHCPPFLFHRHNLHVVRHAHEARRVPCPPPPLQGNNLLSAYKHIFAPKPLVQPAAWATIFHTPLQPHAPGHGVVTVTYVGGGKGQRRKAKFVYPKSTSNFVPL